MSEELASNLPPYEDRSFLIFNVSELNLIDFSKVCETSEDTVRKSIDLTKTFVKWDGLAPEFTSSLSTKDGPYTYDEISIILNTPEWTNTGSFMSI
jgi:hypothetical protein